MIRATEGYTRTLDGERRRLVPVYSLIIATEPLSADGLGADRAAPPRDVQRPPAPDHLRPAHRRRPAGLRRPRRAVPLRLADPHGLRPRRRGCSPRCTPRSSTCSRCCSDAAVTHAWGGALGIARDWTASVGLDRATGLGWAGGYVGDGVSTTNLAGRTLADLVLGRDTELTRLPWVGHRSRSLGAGAAALAGHQRRAAGDDLGRPGGGAAPAARAGSPSWSRRCSAEPSQARWRRCRPAWPAAPARRRRTTSRSWPLMLRGQRLELAGRAVPVAVPGGPGPQQVGEVVAARSGGAVRPAPSPPAGRPASRTGRPARGRRRSAARTSCAPACRAYASCSQVAVLGPPWSSVQRCSMNVAKPSLSQTSRQWWTDTESPNHWCASSCTISEPADADRVRRPGLGLQGEPGVERGDHSPGLGERVAAELPARASARSGRSGPAPRRADRRRPRGSRCETAR